MARAGRPRKTGVKRTKSGRISQAKGAYAENDDPIKTRMRMFGLTEKDARDQKAGTFIGRLYLTGELGCRPGSDAAWEASQEYLRLREAFQRAVKSPDALRSSGGGGDSGESATYAAWCKGAITRFEEAESAVQVEQNVLRGSASLFAALDYIVCRNEEQHHMVGDVRLALNALANHFGMLGKGKRRAVDKSVEEAA